MYLYYLTTHPLYSHYGTFPCLHLALLIKAAQRFSMPEYSFSPVITALTNQHTVFMISSLNTKQYASKALVTYSYLYKS